MRRGEWDAGCEKLTLKSAKRGLPSADNKHVGGLHRDEIHLA